MAAPQVHRRGTHGDDVRHADRAVVAGRTVRTAATLERVRAIRRQIRLESGRPDGRCGTVAEAVRDELGWAYRWGHLRLLDGGVRWIHCWNQLPDGTIVDATADQFEERWVGDASGVAVLLPGDPLHASYRAAPPGHRFRAVLAGGHRRLLIRQGMSSGTFAALEPQEATAEDTEQGWAVLGAAAVQVHSGWRLPDWIGEAAGIQLHEAAAAGQALPSRALEFALDAAARPRRIACHGAWTSPEWRAAHAARN